MILASEFASWVDGTLEGDDVSFEGVTFDSRTTTPNCLYAALDGATVDGHEFVVKSFQLGASVALVKKDWPSQDGSGTLIRVDNPRTALTVAARCYRKVLKAKVVGVTGSAGKTTTKELTAAFLRQGGKTSATVGNFNNDLGLPVTMLRTARDADFAVWEMGSNHPGEIAYLVDLAKPDVGIISSVGTAHIEFFKTQDGIAQEKGSLFSALPQNGFAVVGKENERYSVLKDLASAKVIETSLEDASADYFAEIKDVLSGSFTVFEKGEKSADIKISLPGKHNVSNALLAYACARELGVSAARCESALENFALPGERWNVVKKDDSSTWINDAYNANPTSMIASLETFARMDAKKKIAVLGDMFELGDKSKELHALVGKRVRELPVDLIITVGEASKSIAKEISPEKSIHFAGVEEVRKYLSGENLESCAILLKASRGMRLEKILQ